MNVIICLDKNNGNFFNGRRQSLDREIIKKIALLVNNKTIWMSPYSAELFDAVKKIPVHKHVDVHYMDQAENLDYCFVEGDSLKQYIKEINTILIFRWDKVYPADRYLDISLSDFTPVYEMGFHGNSHEQIIMEMYKKKIPGMK